MKKRIIKISLMFCLLVFGGCSSSYERNIQPGEIKQITLAEMEEKFARKESFAIMLTQSRCSYCMEFEGLLKEYISDHRVVMYDVVLDKEDRTESENLEIIKKYFEEFYSTPSIHYVKDGVSKSQLKGKKEGIDEEMLDQWVTKNEIDKE